MRLAWLPPGRLRAGRVDNSGVLARLAHSVAGVPAIYDLIQKVARIERCNAYCRLSVGQMVPGALVIDAGGGTGLARSIFPADCRFVCLDTDPAKLKRFAANRRLTGEAWLGDVTAMPFGDDTIDLVFTRAVSHHLPDRAFDLFMAESRRVLKPGGRLMFVDGFLNPPNRLSNLMWKYDPGTMARDASEILRAITRHFTIISEQRVHLLHDVLLVTASPLG